jgi:hypothetical protein
MHDTLKKPKPLLVLYGVPYQTWSFFHDDWFKFMVDEYFNIEHYDETKTYSNDTTFVTGCNVYADPEHRNKFIDRKLIVDVTWESFVGKWGKKVYNHRSDRHYFIYGNHSRDTVENAVFMPNFFWYHFSLWWRAREIYPYMPDRTYNKKFLLPIGHNRGWREEVLTALTPWLDQSLWSCMSKGQHLPGPIVRSGKRVDWAYSNPDWYNQTCYSIVLETAKKWGAMSLFLTEKTYKPIAFKHPFMLMSAPGALAYLKSQGFETFDNIFDESYDTTDVFQDKLDIVKNNILNFAGAPFDPETIRRTEHNYNLFYNTDRILSGLKEELINPMLEFIERK